MFSLQIVLLWLVLFALFSIIGFLISRLIRIHLYLSNVFAVNLPIYILMGFSFLTFSLTLIGLFTVGLSALVILSSILVAILLVVFHFQPKRFSFSMANFIPFIKSRFLSIDNMFPLFLFSFVLYFFLDIINRMLWPPVGDVVSGHGPYTSLILFNGRLTFSLEPLAPWSITYPPGFHVLTANVASWLNLLPGEAILLIGGLSLILVFWSMYSLTWLCTRSKILSTAALLSLFVVHPSENAARYIIGSLYSDDFPCLLAILFSIFSIIMLAVIDQNENFGDKPMLSVNLGLLTVTLALLVTYPPCLLIIGIEFVYLLLKYLNFYVSIASRNFKKILAISVFIIISLLIVSNLEITQVVLHRVFSRLVEPYAVKISFSFLHDHITGFAMIIGFIMALLLLLGKKHEGICAVYFTSFILVLLRLIEPSKIGTEFFMMIVFHRFHMIPWLISWSMIAKGIYELAKRFDIEKNKIFIQFGSSAPKISFNISLRPIVFLLFLLVSTTLFMPDIIYLQNKTPNYYTAKDAWTHDYEGLLWIHNNIAPHDLILNDYSWAGQWILSFSYKNTTSNFHKAIRKLDRTLKLNEIWKGQMSPSKVYDLLKRYNVTYIFTTSDHGYYTWPLMYNERGRYVSKPMNPRSIMKMFDSYPFLECKFRSGSTAIYKVNYEFGGDLSLLLDLRLCVEKNTIRDNSIYQNNACVYGIDIVESEIGPVLCFNGKNSCVLIEDTPLLRLRSDFTIELLIYLNDKNKAFNSGIAKGNTFGAPSKYDYRIDFHLGTVRFSVSDGENNCTVSTTEIESKKWMHIVAMRDSGSLLLYVNGELKDQKNITVSTGQSSKMLIIGARIKGGTPIYVLEGMIGRVRIYDRSLDYNEIMKLYKEGEI